MRLAGEVADGVLLNYLPATHVPWSVEQVRKSGDARIYCYAHVGVTDREAYLSLAQAWLAQTSPSGQSRSMTQATQLPDD